MIPMCLSHTTGKEEKGSDHTMNEDTPKEKEAKPQSSLVDKIQQLGQSNVPQPGDSNIHVLPIIGQVEGHAAATAK